MTILVSASMVKDYVSCNRKVYWRRASEGFLNVAPTTSMYIGNIVHQALAEHWRSEEETFNFLKKSFKGDSNRSLLVDAEKCVTSYFRLFHRLTTTTDLIEFPFKIQLKEDVYLVGKFDRVSSGKVLDWKTGSGNVSNIDNDPQFIIYHEAYKRLYGSDPRGVYLMALRTGKIVEFNSSKYYRDLVFNRVIPNMVRDIRNNNLIPTGAFSKELCEQCLYKVGCSIEGNQ